MGNYLGNLVYDVMNNCHDYFSKCDEIYHQWRNNIADKYELVMYDFYFNYSDSMFCFTTFPNLSFYPVHLTPSPLSLEIVASKLLQWWDGEEWEDEWEGGCKPQTSSKDFDDSELFEEQSTRPTFIVYVEPFLPQTNCKN